MKKSGATLGDLRVCIEEEIYVITERYRKFFEDVAAGGGSFTVLGGAAVWPYVAVAQGAKKRPVVGILGQGTPAQRKGEFLTIVAPVRVVVTPAKRRPRWPRPRKRSFGNGSFAGRCWRMMVWWTASTRQR